ncbi:MAG: division/cell wall cluster transcriptional repressor MraZ [Chloroflexi bacterium]|nr:division/cell wall cluster transcriptional repressor MraZ [Chloroflexota bacterium]
MGNRPQEAEGSVERHFAGEFAHSLDEKGRLAIPAKFRGRFKEGAVVTRWIGECLAVFPTSEWDAINADIAKRPRTDPTVQQFVHFVVGGAHEAEPDGQGRIVIPAHLRQHAGLAGEAVVIGASRHVEVWEPGRWRARLAEVGPAIGEKLAGLGI